MGLVISWLMAMAACILAVSAWTKGLSIADGLASFLPFSLACAGIGLLLAYRKRAILPALLSLAAAGAAIMSFVGEWRAIEGSARPGPGRIVIVTHNVGVANHDPAGTIEFLLHSGADILLLQETRGVMRPWLNRLRSRYPYGNHCPAGCDLTIAARLPMGRVRWKLRDSAGRKLEPPLIYAEIFPGEPRAFTVATIHLPWPYPHNKQAAWRDRLVLAFGQLDRRRVILAGDFNLTPWGMAMRDLQDGLAPMRRLSRMEPSFPARVGQKGMAWPAPILPIDHVFAGPYWRTARVERLGRTGSDHFPLRVTLDPKN